MSIGRHIEEPLPYDCDVELASQKVPSIDDFHPQSELVSRPPSPMPDYIPDAFIPEPIAAAAPMEMVPTTPYMFSSPMTRFLARAKWDHSKSFLHHVYRSYACSDTEDITKMSATTRDLLVLASNIYHQRELFVEAVITKTVIGILIPL
ncbi:hypothetical protein RJT34_07378 [Clitoria ternatea]|uniref:Uncharacterized protein n=1 Tax=Clitoria ternatea TaxID=43366 RepID=A0AAN9K4D6_CLITE